MRQALPPKRLCCKKRWTAPAVLRYVKLPSNTRSAPEPASNVGESRSVPGMGSTHFLTKTLANVGTEMSLHVLAYNFKRAMRIPGVPNMMQAENEVAPQKWSLLISTQN